MECGSRRVNIFRCWSETHKCTYFAYTLRRVTNVEKITQSILPTNQY